VNPTIDLVADLGEGFGAYTIGDDSELLEIVTSANIACGFHAGDPDIMAATVAECVRRGVGIGAHPSFPDLRGFGRRDMGLSASEVQNDVLYQLGALNGFAAFHGTKVTHLAPHGRLGNLVAVRADYAQAVAEAAARVDNELIVVAQEGELAAASRAAGLDVAIVGSWTVPTRKTARWFPAASLVLCCTIPQRSWSAHSGWWLTARSAAPTAQI
jgi:UPF0271 protein